MTHLSKEEYLTAENMDQYFSALAMKIKAAGIGEHSILVVGGAAMALKYRWTMTNESYVWFLIN